MIKRIVAVAVGAVFLSGCSMPVPGAGSEKGSIWKSSDSGQTFAVKSRVDEKRSIASADVL
jgi:PBP1b-binding outer membrane lipoprotein LpoB